MLRVPALLGQAERCDAIQLRHGALRGGEQDLVHVRVLRPARGATTRLPNDQGEHREHHKGERDLDRELRDLGGRRGEPELRLRRLDVVGGLAGLNHARDDDRDLRGRDDTGLAGG